MLPLGELQSAVRAALLDDEEAAAARVVAGDGLDPRARLAIYRHHVFTSLTAALEATYPVVCRLVDARFFGWAAHEFIQAHPPASACLLEYGAGFADFLAGFPACRHLAYLPDVARLEWALSRALHADDHAAIDPAALADLAPSQVEGLTLRLDPSLALLASPWPIDRIWRANQPGADPEVVIDLAASPGARLEVRRLDDDVAFRALPADAHAFRRALLAGHDLAAATAAARAADATFDLAGALRALLDERLVAGFTVRVCGRSHHAAG